MLFWQFSNITIYIRVYGKMPDQYFKVSLFSNPGDKVLILVESRGQIFLIVFHLLRTLSPGLKKNDRLKCWSCNFPWTLYYMVMLKNCCNNISMQGCSPIQGTNFLFFFMKPESQSGTHKNLCMTFTNNLGFQRICPLSRCFL